MSCWIYPEAKLSLLIRLELEYEKDQSFLKHNTLLSQEKQKKQPLADGVTKTLTFFFFSKKSPKTLTGSFYYYHQKPLQLNFLLISSRV